MSEIIFFPRFLSSSKLHKVLLWGFREVKTMEVFSIQPKNFFFFPFFSPKKRRKKKEKEKKNFYTFSSFFIYNSVTPTNSHLGSNWGSSTRGTALTRFVFIGCYDNGNNPDGNACRNNWLKYIWTPLKIGHGLVVDERGTDFLYLI